MKLNCKQVNSRSVFVVVMITCAISLCIAAGFAFAQDIDDEKLANETQLTQTTTEEKTGNVTEPEVTKENEGGSTEETKIEENGDSKATEDDTVSDRTTKEEAQQTQESIAAVSDTPAKATEQVSNGLVDDDPLPAEEKSSESMKYYRDFWSDPEYPEYEEYRDCIFATDVQGIDKEDTIQTTYFNCGYDVSLSVDDNQLHSAESFGSSSKSEWFSKPLLGKVYTFEDKTKIQIKQHASLVNDGTGVKFDYTICNNYVDDTDPEYKDFQFAVNADVMLDNDDYAKVYYSQFGNKITEESNTGKQLVIKGDNLTPFDGMWIGRYSESGVDYYEHSFESSTPGSSYTEGDSAFAGHWNIRLAKGEVVHKSYIVGVKEVDTDLTIENAQTKVTNDSKLNLQIEYVDAASKTQYLYCKFDDGEYPTEPCATSQTSEIETSGMFNYSTDISGWELGTTKKLTYKLTNNNGKETEERSVYVYYPGPGGTGSDFYTLRLLNTTTEIAQIVASQNSTIILPDVSEKIEGKEFKGWNTKLDGTGTNYSAGDEYSLLNNTILYARWATYISGATVSDIVNQTYTGNEIKPEPIVSYSEETLNQILVKDTDYTLSYNDNMDAGEATVIITGIGNYTGTKQVNFNIIAKDITEPDVAYTAIEDQVYTGSAITPVPEIKYNDMTLENEVDFSITYSNNTNVGEATATVNGTGNYKGSKDIKFNIVGQDIPGGGNNSNVNSGANSFGTPSSGSTTGDNLLIVMLMALVLAGGSLGIVVLVHKKNLIKSIK